MAPLRHWQLLHGWVSSAKIWYISHGEEWFLRMPSTEAPWTDALIPFAVSEDSRIEAIRAACTVAEALVAAGGLVAANYVMVATVGREHPQFAAWMTAHVMEPAGVTICVTGLIGMVFHGWMAHPRG